MHTFEWTGLAWIADYADTHDATVTIHHDGDPNGGNVIINVPTYVGDPQVDHFSREGEDHHIAQLTVPYDALKAFFAEMVRRRRIAELEQMDSDEVLHLLA
jgi:hypothetical protein